MLKRLVTILLTISALAVLSGCYPTVLGSAVTSAGVMVAQERSVGDAIDDHAIWTQIKHHYLQEDVKTLLAKVGVEVHEGRVLLTGSVKNMDTMVNAVRLAWKPKNVTEVINEIQAKNRSVKDAAKDTWITTQVKTRLMLNKDIKSINYHVETVNKVVYLFGIAASEEEHEPASLMARTVKGVAKVISHIRVAVES